MPNIPNKEDELQIVKCFGDAQVYDGGWHAEYDGKWIDITNEVYNVKRLMEAREKSIREEARENINSLHRDHRLLMSAILHECGGRLDISKVSFNKASLKDDIIVSNPSVRNHVSYRLRTNTQVNKGEKNGHA